MTREEYDKIKPLLLDVLVKSSPLTPEQFLEKLTSDVELEDSVARNAIWRLIDDGDIHVSLERKFEAARA
jgi:hypothetical protein